MSLRCVLLLACSVCAAGCGPPPVVRVTVPAEDVAHANQVLQDGDVAFARRDYYAALIRYLEASRLNPNSENTYNRLGIAYSQLKFYPEAASAFVRSIALNPKLAYTYNNLASVYYAQHNLRRAEKYYKKALSLNPQTAAFYVNLASLYLERKKPRDGMAAYKKAIELDPSVLGKSANTIESAAINSSPAERNYVMARLYGSIGDAGNAVLSLENALNAGFSDLQAIQTEQDFDPIRKDPRFVELAEKIELLLKK
jgi:tetratricopeptide (TPR) repeat protein